MEKGSYEYQPSRLIENDDEPVTLDNWKPTPKKDSLVLSEWRQNQNGKHTDLAPGIDELKKISVFLKNKKSDSDIMKAFGITSETLVAIKRGCYDAVEGISLDNQSKIYKEFTRIDKRIDRLRETLILLNDTLFNNMEMHDRFKKIMGLKGKIKSKKKPDFSDEEE